jgi:hypothetical protein
MILGFLLGVAFIIYVLAFTASSNNEYDERHGKNNNNFKL